MSRVRIISLISIAALLLVWRVACVRELAAAAPACPPIACPTGDSGTCPGQCRCIAQPGEVPRCG